MSQELERSFPDDASLFPHLVDVPSNQIMVSRLSEADLTTASFLDQRLVTPDLPRQYIGWDALAAIPLQDRPSPHYIFHIGHVGSTLIARLLGEHANILSLREPAILRAFAEISPIRTQAHSPWSPETYLLRRDKAVRWLSRTFNPQQRVMIKATSFVSEIAGELMGSDNKALCLYVSLPRYLETILAGYGSRAEARQLASARLIRLNQRLGADVAHLWQLTPVQIVALGWLTEMTALIEALDGAQAAQVRWQDFDMFLSHPKSELSAVAAHFDIKFSDRDLSTLMAGPIMNSYSKAPEHDYSADLRQQLLEQARREYGDQIAQTVDWVVDLGEKYSLIAQALDMLPRTSQVGDYNV